MARKGYIATNGGTERVRHVYVGDESGKARKVKKVYLGVDDRAKLIMEVRRYTATFEANGGSGTTASVYCEKILDYGEEATITLPSSGFSRGGYGFQGWCTNADCVGTIYKAGSTVSINKNMVFYAKWLKLYSITYWKTADLNWAAASVTPSFNNMDLTQATGPVAGNPPYLDCQIEYPEHWSGSVTNFSAGWNGKFTSQERPSTLGTSDFGIPTSILNVRWATSNARARTGETTLNNIPAGTKLKFLVRNHYHNGGEKCCIYNGSDTSSGILAQPSTYIEYTYTVGSNLNIRANWKTSGDYVPVGTEILNLIAGWLPNYSATDDRNSWWDIHITQV